MPASLLDSQLETLEMPGADENALTLDAQLPLTQLMDAAFVGLGLAQTRGR
jgi:gluconokinase